MNNNFDFDGWHLSLFNATHFEIFATYRFNFPESSEGSGEHAKIVYRLRTDVALLIQD